MIKNIITRLLFFVFVLGMANLALGDGPVDAATDSKYKMQPTPLSSPVGEQNPELMDMGKGKKVNLIDTSGKDKKDKDLDSDKETKIVYKALFEALQKSTSKTELKYSVADVLQKNYATSDEKLCTRVEAMLTASAKKLDPNLYKLISEIVSGKCNASKADNSKESLLPCKVTPEIKPGFVLDSKINKSNNLIRKTGAVARAAGEYVTITGTVMDEQCLPIGDAVVTIWQNDSNGKNINDYKAANKWQPKDPEYDKNFAYSGTAQTDNFGKFSFITILPGISEDQADSAPHFNIKIEHAKFSKLRSRIYLSKHTNNSRDPALIALTKEKDGEELVQRVMAKGSAIDPTHKLEGRQYEINLVLGGIAHYREY